MENTLISDALKKGREEGRTEGLEQGREQGLEQGRAEERLDIARKMKSQSLPVETIKLVTGLSEAEIADL